MNIVLIGYRGTGKSTVGRIIADRCRMRIVSTDEQIVVRAGKSIPEIVAESGWDAFRDIEAIVVAEVASMDSIIIDAGGGVIIRQKNVDILRKSGIIFWLTAAIPTIAKRIYDDTERPSLTGNKSFIEEIEEVLKVREPLYRSAAHHIIDTEGRTPEDVAADIINKWTEDSRQRTVS